TARLEAIIFRFRQPLIATVGDLEKAFLHIQPHPTDRDITRFHWVNNSSAPISDDSLVVTYRFCRVLVGAILSSLLLAGAIRHHLAQSNSSLAPECTARPKKYSTQQN
ncbi:hypothetical protein AB6A40_011608, partial [Gnathostoma spinigerum]